MRYFDTSALVKQYLQEAGSTTVLELLKTREQRYFSPRSTRRSDKEEGSNLKKNLSPSSVISVWFERCSRGEPINRNPTVATEVFAMNRVLVVDDDAASRRLLEVRLRPLECDVATAGNGEQALTAIRKDVPDLMLLDLEMPKMGGIEVLRALRKEEINVPVVVITAHGSIETAVEAMKEGAYDFITKPLDANHFDIVVRKALEREGLKRELELFSEDADRRYRLVVGKSDKMNEAVETAKKAATSKATVLLLGESGTGKEIFARAIHNWSERRSQPFVAINCVGLSKELLESELFGHEKGSFTGADQLKKGKMELANGGTVFLDEIGDVSQELQTKLLRFLQEREFDRVGGVRPIHVDVRIVAATNRDLDVAVKEGRFP